ncbi:unnamed protein product [Phytomonas sp. Hart1]|nr:unnamed protein product [Phytomonas sp. Hart1]|eukprot:CCW66310.1 unnamed protein product [Phytomonas sp. isolate Hart1]
MASAIYILDSKGAPLIFRTYRGDVLQDVPAVFRRHVLDEDESRITPVFIEDGTTYVFVQHNNVYFLAVSNVNSFILQQVAFLRRCITVFESYFKRVKEETIRDNFVIIYELLDEMTDFGFPQYTEGKVLKDYIYQKGLIASLFLDDTLSTKTLPAAVTGMSGVTPWRMPGKYMYNNNEVLFDVVEQISLLVGQNGDILSSNIRGSVLANVHLSGMPQLHMGLNDKLFFDLNGRRTARNAIDLEDLKFHGCVKLNLFESERIISFIPPDGKFELFSYRLSKKMMPPVMVVCHVTRFGTSRVQISCKVHTMYPQKVAANSMEIFIPIPPDADLPLSSSSHGIFHYDAGSNFLVWNLHNVSGKREFNCTAQFHLPSVRNTEALAKAPIQVRFEIPYFVPSGFQIRYVKVTERSNYESLAWVRYLARSGDYQIRTS